MTRKTALLLSGALAAALFASIPTIPSSAATLAKDFLTAPIAAASTIKDPVAYQQFAASFGKGCTRLSTFTGDRLTGTKLVTTTGTPCVTTGVLGIHLDHVAALRATGTDQAGAVKTVATQ